MKKTILVIEDDTSLLSNIVYILEREDYQVITNKTGTGILEILTGQKINLVLCDIKLPANNGFDVLEELRREMNLIDIPPFLFLTAMVETDDIRRGMALGADDYLTKPYTRQELLSAITAQLEKRERLTQG